MKEYRRYPQLLKLFVLHIKNAENFERFVQNYIANTFFIFLAGHEILRSDYQTVPKEILALKEI